MRAYKKISKVLENKLNCQKFLINTHRGISGGSVVENTTRAKTAAFLTGSDIVEVDITGSIDGQNYIFHDGNEVRVLGLDVDTLKMTSKAIDNIECYTNCGAKAGHSLEKLEQFLENIKQEELINIDRAWVGSEDFLEQLDKYQVLDNVILKSNISDKKFLEQIDQHPTKYMFIAIVRNEKEWNQFLAYKDINIIGVEIVSASNDSPISRKNYIQSLKNERYLIMLNAEIVGKVPLFNGYDDDKSIFEDGYQGWEKLYEYGADIIITDWPQLMFKYREQL